MYNHVQVVQKLLLSCPVEQTVMYGFVLRLTENILSAGENSQQGGYLPAKAARTVVKL